MKKRLTTAIVIAPLMFVSATLAGADVAGASDGFDEDARTVGEFTLDQRMRQGTWVPAPVPSS